MDKYIIYKTTNLINGYIYIGVHKTSKPYEFDGYIGNGIWIYKPYTYQKGKTKMQQAVKEFGVKNFKRETLIVFDTAEAAYKEEERLVNEEFLSRNDVYNMVLGGELQEYKSIITYQYDLDGNFIAEYESIKDAARSVGCNPGSLREAIVYNIKIKNYYWANFKVDKLQLESYKNTEKNKPVQISIYDLHTKKFIKSFDSLYKASKFMGLSTSIQICRAARFGYSIKDKYLCSFIEAESYDKANSIYIKNRPVYKYDSNGNFIEGYNTQLDAEKANPYSNITRFIKNKKVDSNGFMWSLDKLDVYNSSKKNKCKKIGRYDLNGNLLDTFPSITACSKVWGKGVTHCICGQYKTHKGYVFKEIS